MGRKNKSILPVLIIAAALIFVLLLDIWQVFRLTSNLTRSIGQYHLESISGELEATISDAQQLTMQLAIAAGPVLDDRGQTETFIYAQKADILARGIGCFNVYIAGPGWAVIPDFAMPEDYVATERDWYRGAKLSQGKPYVTAPYVDAMTGNICYTVAVLLGDRETVLGLDYTMDNIQSHISQMYESGSQYALIVTGDGIIAGCSDERLIGRHLTDVLPEYSSVYSLVKSRNSFVTARIKSDVLYENLFAAASGFGWYLIVSENDWNLYRYAYLQLIGSMVLALLLLGMIVTLYLLSVRRQRAALGQVQERDRLLFRLSDQLTGPLAALLDGGGVEKTGAETENLFRLRAVSRQVLETLRDADQTAIHPRPRKKQKQSQSETAPRMNKRFRTRILLLMILVVLMSFASNLWLSLRWGNEKLRGEVNSYDYTLSEWVSQQKSILDMFCSVISTNPELLDDYDGMVAYLNRITRQYPEISVTYMTNPDRNPTVIMNNGWLPPEGWRVEERQWFIDTLAAEDGWTISAPYFDEQTGLYCVTFAERVYDNESGAFLGNFGIDFFMDKLIGILGGSYSDTGYAFLADTEGIIVNHPYGSYQMSVNNAVNVSEVLYGEAKADGNSSIVIRDYDGALRIITAKRNAQSGFTVFEAASFASIYAPTFLTAFLIFLVLLICAVMVYRLLTALILWQDKMNARIQEAADTAIAAGEAKSRFLAQMSHEIRTPINAVLGMNEMILRKTEDETILDYSANIQTAGKTLLSLINSILDFSKIEEGKMEIVPVEYGTASFIHNLVASIEERAKDKGLELIVEAAPSLPSRLYGDDVRLSQVILNLLTNAVKYTEKGRVRFSIQGTSRQDDEVALSVSVEDTGIGIREEDLPRLFESFERLDEVRNHNIEGTGLGMSIVTRLLRMMDSRLEVHSVYGEGSSFSFVVRQKVLDDTPIGDYTQRLEASRASGGGETLAAGGARILVVDDNEMNLKVAKNLMELFQIAPDMASSGFEAIERIRSTRYHIVFLDHMMPKMDGIETLNALRLEKLLPEETVVIALTANAVNGAKEYYLSAGFHDYLSKPIDIGKLETLLRRYLPAHLIEETDKAKQLLEDKTDHYSREKTDSKKEETFLAPLRALGYDTRSALNYAAGSEAFYRELLRDFCASAPWEMEQIRQAWERREWDGYQTQVHALKGIARQIGANGLSELALAQEQAAKQRNESTIDAGAEELLRRYGETAEELRSVSDEAGDETQARSGEPGGAGGGGLSAGELKALLTEAKTCIENFETGAALELLRPLTKSASRPPDLGDTLAEICEALDEFDTGTAAERLDEALRRLTEE
ncbi:MAG: response regulator [Oscillospiraceae bacterium]|nr:response regulator [Oscillospiraceae bacterium]